MNTIKKELIKAAPLAAKKANEAMRELEARAKIKQFLLDYQEVLHNIAVNNGRTDCKNCGMSNELVGEVIKYFNK